MQASNERGWLWLCRFGQEPGRDKGDRHNLTGSARAAAAQAAKKKGTGRQEPAVHREKESARAEPSARTYRPSWRSLATEDGGLAWTGTSEDSELHLLGVNEAPRDLANNAGKFYGSFITGIAVMGGTGTWRPRRCKIPGPEPRPRPDSLAVADPLASTATSKPE